MTLERIINPNLKKLAEQYSEKYPYPDVDEWIQFGEMVLFQNVLSEKDIQKRLIQAESDRDTEAERVRINFKIMENLGLKNSIDGWTNKRAEAAEKLAEEWEAEAARRGMAITRLQNGAVENKR